MTSSIVVLLAALAAAPASEPVPTLVFDVQAKADVSAAVAAAMTEVVHGVFDTDPGRRVLGRRALVQLARFEAERQAIGCDDDSCLLEIAEALAVDRLVLASVAKLGTKYLVIIRELDANALRPLGRAEGTVSLKPSAFIDDVRRLATEARDAGAGGQVGEGRLVVRVAPAGGTVLVGGRTVGADEVELGGLTPGTQTVTVEHGSARAVFAVPVDDNALTRLEVTMDLGGPSTTPYEEETYGTLAWQRWGVGGVELGAGAVMTVHGLLGVAFGFAALAISPPGASSGDLSVGEVWAGFAGLFTASAVALVAGMLMMGAGGWTFLQAPSAPARPPVHKALLLQGGDTIELEAPDAGG
jgi:hypothetical protein